MERKIEILFQFVIVSLFLISILSLPIQPNYIEINKDDLSIVQKTTDETSLKGDVLYISRHNGTIGNFIYIVEHLNFKNISILNPNYEYGKKLNCYDNDKCKSYVEKMCSNFNYIVISDIIADSYIYFTNECKAKVILEITNRYSCYIYGENKKIYDQELSKAVNEKKNIVVVENNPYEVYYACLSNVFIKNYYLIRPVGYPASYLLKDKHDEIHDEIAITKTSLQDWEIGIPMLKKYGVKFSVLEHSYGGPLVLATYKAVIMLPYQLSVMKMYENIRYGVAMICPTERLLRELIKDPNYRMFSKGVFDIQDGPSRFIEFYNNEFKDLFVYFDKWEDLPEIIKNTNFEEIKSKCKKYMENYEKKALKLWSQAFGLLPPNDIIKDEKPLCHQ